MATTGSATNVIASVVGGAGTTTVVTYGTHRYTERSIEEELFDEISYFNHYSVDERALLEKKFRDSNRDYERYGLLNYKSLVDDRNVEKWCENVGGMSYESWVMGRDEVLKYVTKKFCNLTIGEKLVDERVIVNSMDSIINDYNGDPELDIEANKDLKIIMDRRDSKTVEDLRMWCDDMYERVYRGEKDNDFRLTKQFCRNI